MFSEHELLVILPELVHVGSGSGSGGWLPLLLAQR